MIERKTREYWMIRVSGQAPNGVMAALESLRSKYSEHWNEIFKTVTTDNGSEFSKLSELEELYEALVYFAHPYISYELDNKKRVCKPPHLNSLLSIFSSLPYSNVWSLDEFEY